MQITDLRRVRAGTEFTCGICIVGSGAAGLTIATELANTHHDVLVVESGDRNRETAFSAALNEIESVGEPREMDQGKLRNRVLGGTTKTWSGRCIAFDPIDFEARPWVPYSGWPLKGEDLAPTLERVSDYLGLIRSECDDASFVDSNARCRSEVQESTELRSIQWQFSRGRSLKNDYVRFAPRFAKLRAANIRVLTNATVTNIATDEGGGHVHSVEIVTPGGVVHQVRSRYFVLCGGGIENARMLLASNRIDPQGVGNRRGLVGRFLMDHPRAVLGTFPAGSEAPVEQRYGLLDRESGARIQRGLSLSIKVQGDEKLLNCAAWTTQHVAGDDVWRAMRTAGGYHGRKRLAVGKIAFQHTDQIVAGLWQRYVLGRPLPRRMGRLDLEVMIEQTPDSSSRITLSSRKDRLGVPLSRIDWKIGKLERLTALRLGHAVNEDLARAGLPAATLVEWVRDRRPGDAVFADPAHPMGATRMADSDSAGVVDRDCKVFGVDNLYIAGSSVFPTSGHANPTLMIVALAVRLADTLRHGADEGKMQNEEPAGVTVGS